MKKQQKKAFTLVELLVVIAILAILSTVAVVGYTSFIKKSAVSNDENLAEQLNRYLDALKADSTGEFYNATIDETNFAALIDEITTNGLGGDIEASAAKYGVHIYFDKSAQKFKALEEDAVLEQTPDYTAIWTATAAGEADFKHFSPYSCFTKGENYMLADTVGEWADVIKAYKNIKDRGSLEDAYEMAKEMTIGGVSVAGVAQLIETTVFVTNNVNLVVSVAEDVVHNNIVVNSDVEVISGSKTPLTGDSVTIGEDTALFAPKGDNVVITIPSSIQYLAPGFANIEDGTTVTVIIEKNTAEDIAEVLEKGVSFGEGVTVQNNNGAQVTIEDGNVVVNGESKEVVEKNTITNFDITISGDIVNGDYIAWGGAYTFDVEITGKKYPEQPLFSEDVTWTVTATNKTAGNLDNFVEIDADGKLTFKADNGVAPELDYVTVTAEAVGGFRKTWTLSVVRVTGVVDGLKINDKDVENAPNITLLKDGDNDTYSISAVKAEYNHKDVSLFEHNVSWAYDGNGTSEKEGTTTIKLNGEAGKGTLTVALGYGSVTHVKYNITLNVANTSEFAFVPVNGNYTVLGNSDAIRLADLFTLREGAELPEGAMLEVYNSTQFNDDTYMKPHRAPFPTTGEGMTVNANQVAITGTNFNDFSVTFTGTSEGDTVRFAIVQNGVRISNDVEVQIIDAVNVRDYSDLTTALSGANKNIVMLDEITMTSGGYITIGKDYTLYGNGYTFDIKQGRNASGIISLAGTIRDIKILGEVYADFAFSRGDAYGSSAVAATNGAYIYNSYISNTRAPLEVGSGTVVIEDSVLFGGRYANVDMVGGTLTIKGTVTTVQQLYNDVIGIGVSAWFNDSQKNIVVEDGANLIQYNFMNEDIKAKLPVLELGIYEIMDLKEPFNYIFSNSAEYGKYTFTGSDGKLYVNSGLVATDKYMLTYSVTGSSPERDGYLGGKKYEAGATKTINLSDALKKTVKDDEEFTIVYDSTKFTAPGNVGTLLAAGSLKVTGAELKAGVTFTVCSKISWNPLTLNGDPTGYMFQIQSDNYKTLVVDGADGYNSLTYTFTKDLSGKMGLVDSAGDLLGSDASLHGKGLHYGKMCVDVYTFENTNTEYQNYLENYINMGTFYYPEYYQFNGGVITNFQGK